jgi:hypothetical protein
MTVRCIDGGGVSMSRRRRRLVCTPKPSAVHRGPARSRRPRFSTPLAGGAWSIFRTLSEDGAKWRRSPVSRPPFRLSHLSQMSQLRGYFPRG